jgi:hypothetical protein
VGGFAIPGFLAMLRHCQMVYVSGDEELPGRTVMDFFGVGSWRTIITVGDDGLCEGLDSCTIACVSARDLGRRGYLRKYYVLSLSNAMDCLKW